MPFFSTVAQNFEQLGFNGPELAQHRAAARAVISEAVATRILTAKESGTLVCSDVASGVIFTLPPPVAGMFYEFVVTTTITTNNFRVNTDAATTFILGAVLTYTAATASPAGFAFNGTSNVAFVANGTTTGGIAGTRIRFTALSTNTWAIDGTVLGSGVITTPAV